MGRLTYTTQEVQDRLDSVGQMVRPNLLDNWYFVGGGSQGTVGAFPINQRGETSYAGSKYGIDRWRAWNANITVTLTSGGLTIRNADSSAVQQVTQYFSAADTAILTGKTATISALIDGVIYSATGVCGTGFSTYPPSMTLQCILANGGLVAFQMWTAKNATTGTIQAVKFELGDTQTLAHWNDSTQAWVLNEVPNFGQELAKCQRYFYRFDYHGINYGTMFGKATSTTSARVTLPLPVRMRTSPAISSKGQIRIEYNGTNALSSDYTIYATSDEGVAFAIASLSSGSLPGDGYPVYAFFNTETDTDLSADL